MTRVAHVIPAAFNYFDDIQSEAFSLVEGLGELGIDNEAFTIEFGGSVSKSKHERVERVAPSRSFGGLSPFADVVDSFDQFDILHVHCPLFGAAGKIIKWKKAHPHIPFLVTYYHPMAMPDFFSLIIIGYNVLYLPKLFILADAVASPEPHGIPTGLVAKNKRILEVNSVVNFSKSELTIIPEGERLARNYAMLYTTLANWIDHSNPLI